MGDAGQRREAGAGGGQIGRTLTLVNRDAEGPATGSKPADDVAVDPMVQPSSAGLDCEHPTITAFHGRHFP
jgi:hypothetical protein